MLKLKTEPLKFNNCRTSLFFSMMFLSQQQCSIFFGLYIDLVFSTHGVKVFCGDFSGAIFAGDVQMVQRLVECRADVNLGKDREMLFFCHQSLKVINQNWNVSQNWGDDFQFKVSGIFVSKSGNNYLKVVTQCFIVMMMNPKIRSGDLIHVMCWWRWPMK